MRREELYLADMLEAADAIGRFLLESERHSFIADDLLRSAVLHKLAIIGEGAARLPDAFRARHPEIEWGDIVASQHHRSRLLFCGLVHRLGYGDTGRAGASA